MEKFVNGGKNKQKVIYSWENLTVHAKIQGNNNGLISRWFKKEPIIKKQLLNDSKK